MDYSPITPRSALAAESGFGTTASHYGDLNSLEESSGPVDLDLDIGTFITSIVIDCWRGVPKDILHPFAAFVSEAVIRENVDIAASFDEDAIRRLVSPFTAPSGNGANDILTFVCHWPPLTRKERRRLKKIAAKSLGKKQRHIEPEEEENELDFLRTFNPEEYLSMKVFDGIFPDMREYRVLDVYTRRQPITTQDGARLSGTAPYDHDVNVPLHHAHAKLQLIMAPGDAVVVCGLPARDWFETNFSKVENNGDMVMIGNRERHVFFIDHPEYVKTWAPVWKLKKFSKALSWMNELCGIPCNQQWITDRIRQIKANKNKDRFIDHEQHLAQTIVQAKQVDRAAVQMLPRSSHAIESSGESRATSRANTAAFWSACPVKSRYLARIGSPEYYASWGRCISAWYKTPAGLAYKQRKKLPENRYAHAVKHAAARSSSDRGRAHIQACWSAVRATAATWAGTLKWESFRPLLSGLGFELGMALTRFGLDPKEYDDRLTDFRPPKARAGSRLTPTQGLQLDELIWKQAVRKKHPYFTVAEQQRLAIEYGLERVDIRRIIDKKIVWIRRSYAILQRMNVDFDCAADARFAWLTWETIPPADDYDDLVEETASHRTSDDKSGGDSERDDASGGADSGAEIEDTVEERTSYKKRTTPWKQNKVLTRSWYPQSMDYSADSVPRPVWTSKDPKAKDLTHAYRQQLSKFIGYLNENTEAMRAGSTKSSRTKSQPYTELQLHCTNIYLQCAIQELVGTNAHYVQIMRSCAAKFPIFPKRDRKDGDDFLSKITGLGNDMFKALDEAYLQVQAAIDANAKPVKRLRDSMGDDAAMESDSSHVKAKKRARTQELAKPTNFSNHSRYKLQPEDGKTMAKHQKTREHKNDETDVVDLTQ